MSATPHKSTRLLAALLLSLACMAGARAQDACDSLHAVTFTYQDNGGYTYAFSPTSPASGSGILYAEWGFAGMSFQDFSLAAQPQYTFPGTGDYLVCLRATIQDDQQGTCLSTACELVPVPVDSACSGLVAAFTIGIQGGPIQFINQSAASEPVTGMTWDFGDGTSSSEAAPAHAYAGAGPYQACLTVTTANCSASSCNWIYLGPSNVPCGTLLQAAIGVIQYERTIAVFDQSTTSGMNSAISWDFGDGGTATGSPVLHTFMDDGWFQVCGTVDLWGPLTPDTCVSTACEGVSTFIAAGIGTAAAPAALRAFPVPFADVFTVEGVKAGAGWELVDLLGRVRLAGKAGSTGTLPIDGSTLDAGTYLFRLATATGTDVLRVVKSAGAL